MKLEPGPILVRNGQLVDGTGTTPVPGAALLALLIWDGLIPFVGLTAIAPAMSPHTERIDARGGTIVPGWIEAHNHSW